MISFCRRLFGPALCLFASIALQAAPDWTINPTALGNADLEGQLAIALPMGPAAGSAPEFGLQLQLVHTASKVTLKTSERDARIDLLCKAAKFPPIERPKPAPAAKAKGEGTAPGDFFLDSGSGFCPGRRLGRGASSISQSNASYSSIT